MVELIVTIILFIGFIGMGVILFRRIPVLAELSLPEIKKPGVLEKLREKIKNNGTLKPISGELLLQRILSKIRILTLRTDKKTNTWLKKLQQRSLKKKSKFSNDYWKKIRRER